MEKVLVTGAAGFIGFHTVLKLLDEGFEVIGLDNINDYYSPSLKYARLNECGIEQDFIKWYDLVQSNKYKYYRFIRCNLEDKQQLFSLFQTEKFDYVINLAAQAGVRYSIENPDVYIHSNILGFHNVLEAARKFPPKHLIHASSSSIYGSNSKIPFEENDKTDTPVSLYAATKKSNELMSHCYSHLYGLKITCLRFFTVFGSWGRPDMAPMLFAKAIMDKKPIKVFNNGNMQRDFTFVGNIVFGVIKLLNSKEEGRFNVYNIGNGEPINLMDFISNIEKAFESETKKEMLPMQDGDVPKTWANTEKIRRKIGVSQNQNLVENIQEFSSWYKSFFMK
ncbi:MAG: NAD-dependent epimerase/dehydratase family protein [Bacteroidetes bacterium]|nr:NAD-dependent epimerase/dehydratase family protein [Bacteroidota bacterium]